MGLRFLLALLTFGLFLPPAACADRVYVAMGASDAAGIGASPLSRGYVFLIQDALESCGAELELVNLGIPGARIKQFRNIELPLAKLAGPDLITLWAGANDIVAGADPRAFERDLGRVLSALRRASSAQIFVANVPDLTRLPRFQRSPSSKVTVARVAAFNKAIAQQARRAGAVLVDLFSAPLNDSLVSPADGFHPSNRGYSAVADLFLAKIRPRFCRASST